MRYLAIDFGKRRLGLAVSDVSSRLATPYAVRERQGTRLDVADLLQTIKGLEVDAVVFGLPHSLQKDETANEMLRLTRNFATALETALRAAGQNQAIEWWDERFSTSEALHQMRALGVSQKHGREAGGRESVDARAAANILQGFLDHRNDRRQEEVI